MLTLVAILVEALPVSAPRPHLLVLCRTVQTLPLTCFAERARVGVDAGARADDGRAEADGAPCLHQALLPPRPGGAAQRGRRRPFAISAER
eukprot:5889286-Pleurochrysis_carterae.AAC.6